MVVNENSVNLNFNPGGQSISVLSYGNHTVRQDYNLGKHHAAKIL